MPHFFGRHFRKPEGLLGMAASYLMKKGNRIKYEKLVPKLEIGKGDHVLEIGYGHGIGIDMICSQFDCTVTGIDFSPLMHREAVRRNRKHIRSGKATLHCGDYCSFSNGSKCFDRIFLINVIYFWENCELPFAKMREELNDGGTVWISMAHRDDLNKLKFTVDDIFNKYTIEQVTGALQKAGFTDVDYSFDNGYFIRCGGK